MMLAAERIARVILEHHAAAYWAANMPDSTWTTRERIIQEAVRAIEPMIEAEVRQGVMATTQNPT